MTPPSASYLRVVDEKRIHTVKVSVGETLYRALQDLAAGRDRSLSDYCHHRLFLDTYGACTGVRRQTDSLAQSDPE